MKLIVLILTIFLYLNCDNPDPLDVEIYTLDNGLTVMLNEDRNETCLLYTSPSPRDVEESRMPSSA